VRYVQVGLGYRSAAFRRVLGELADFTCVGLVLRRVRTGDVPVYTDLAACLRDVRPDFVLGFTPPATTPGILQTAVAAGVPVLAETPPGSTAAALDGLDEVAASGLVQVAEQYPAMPGHAARLEVRRLGLIGDVSQVQVSSTQTYHAMALIRAFLGVAPGPAEVRAHRFTGPLVDPLTRAGWTADPVAHEAATTLASVDFGAGLSGIYDYTDNQTRNLLRTRRLVVRGSLGEISGEQVVRLAGPGLITTTYFSRRQTGHDLDLNDYTDAGRASHEPARVTEPKEGVDERSEEHCTYQITLGDHVLWTNPWPEHRWNDDELAVATILTRMAAWLRSEGEAPYPLSEALYDARLGLAIEEAVRLDRAVTV